MEKRISDWWSRISDKIRFLIIEKAYWDWYYDDDNSLYDKFGKKLNWGVIGFLIGFIFATIVLIQVKGVL